LSISELLHDKWLETMFGQARIMAFNINLYPYLFLASEDKEVGNMELFINLVLVNTRLLQFHPGYGTPSQ
jgi:hypothetical protein